MFNFVSLLRSSAAACLLPLLLSMGPAAAGPVSDAAIETGPGSIEAAPDLSLKPSAPVLIEDAFPQAGAEPAAPGSAGSAPATTAQAAEIIREAQAGVAAADSLHPTQGAKAQGASQAAASSPGSHGTAHGSDDEGGLRDMGKAALDWFKQAVPWLRDDPDESSADGHLGIDSAEWSDSTLAGGNAGPGGHAAVVAMGGATAATHGRDMVSGYVSDSSRQGLGDQRNYVREIVELLRMVLEHPMTWLLVALLVIGGFAKAKFDRRP